MIKFLISAVLLQTLFAFPADITLLMIEVKYDELQGVKVCELQPVCHSSFFGFDYVYQDYGLMGKKIASYLDQFGQQCWFMDPIVSHKPIRQQLLAHGWKPFSRLDQTGLWEKARFFPSDPNDLSTYSGIVYAKIKNVEEATCFCSRFPGAILIDRFFVPYMYDKYAQSLLFTKDPILEKIKPKWALFKKEYTSNLAIEIIQKLNCEEKEAKFVIKPRNSDRGRGVIIVDKKDLDFTLKKIFSSSLDGIDCQDRGYSYWIKDVSSDFLVEEFIETKPCQSDGQLFDVTFRMAVVFIDHKEKRDLHFLGSYCNLSDISLEEEGSLNQKHKTSLLLERTIRTEVDLEKKIYEELKKPLLILYETMIRSESFIPVGKSLDSFRN